ncbi:MAG: hypothetical protein NTW21_11510 [Verrucomicrobia bacterium]|nr:hypothetical protein [Verrucomicrobiota bacterium]
MPESNRPIGANAHSPFAGCAILVAAMAVMVFLVVFSTWGMFRQYREIAKFTAETPVPVEVAALDGRDGEINPLAERLEQFRQELAGDSATTLALTADELNLAIAAYEPFKDLRGTFRVLAVDGATMRIAISFKLNGKPRFTRKGEDGWIGSDPRFLNATLTARPQLLGREVVLKLDSITVPNAKVPVEFVGQMSPYRITERYLADADIGPAMAKLTAVEVADGRMVLRRQPGEIPADRISAAQVDAASSRLFTLLGIVACVFLTAVGILIFVGLRAKGRPA